MLKTKLLKDKLEDDIDFDYKYFSVCKVFIEGFNKTNTAETRYRALMSFLDFLSKIPHWITHPKQIMELMHKTFHLFAHAMGIL